MADRPVLFRETLVRQILAGEKTVTRRTGATWAKVRAGDRLWVRETWRLAPDVPAYRADYPEDQWAKLGPWRPSIHMPRALSRLSLQVVSVREEAYLLGGGLGQMAVLLPDVDDDEARREGLASRREFLHLWQELHPEALIGPPAGPVYRIEFEVAP